MSPALLLTSVLALPLVAIDPGHGGAADGTVGVCGAKEKDVALQIARELAALLETSGRAQVYLARDADLDRPLEERATEANRRGAALFVSIHANASMRSEHSGIETYFLSRKAADRRALTVAHRENGGRVPGLEHASGELGALLQSLRLNAAHGESQRLATRLQNALVKQLGRRGRGVLQAPFLVLMHAEMAATLVEVGFLSNPDECAQLATVAHQREVAAALGTAILLHLDAENTLAMTKASARH